MSRVISTIESPQRIPFSSIAPREPIHPARRQPALVLAYTSRAVGQNLTQARFAPHCELAGPLRAQKAGAVRCSPDGTVHHDRSPRG